MKDAIISYAIIWQRYQVVVIHHKAYACDKSLREWGINGMQLKRTCTAYYISSTFWPVGYCNLEHILKALLFVIRLKMALLHVKS